MIPTRRPKIGRLEMRHSSEMKVDGPVISYHVHFIFGVTSYQREKLCSLHTMFTSYLESIHIRGHFILLVTSYSGSLHTLGHFILLVSSYWLHRCRGRDQGQGLEFGIRIRDQDEGLGLRIRVIVHTDHYWHQHAKNVTQIRLMSPTCFLSSTSKSLANIMSTTSIGHQHACRPSYFGSLHILDFKSPIQNRLSRDSQTQKI